MVFSTRGTLATLALLGLATLPHTAQAQTTTFTNQATFLAALTSSATQSFDSIGTGDLGATSLPFTAGAFSFTATETGSGSNLWGINSGGDRWLGTQTSTNTLTITITGGSPTALGGNFFTTNNADAFASGPVLLTLNDGTTINYTSAGSSDFGGFTTTSPITSVTFAGPGGSNAAARFATMNNLILGIASSSSAPEPGTLALLALGMVGGLVARRRK